jgi:hypothetical protein
MGQHQLKLGGRASHCFPWEVRGPPHLLAIPDFQKHKGACWPSPQLWQRLGCRCSGTLTWSWSALCEKGMPLASFHSQHQPVLRQEGWGHPTWGFLCPRILAGTEAVLRLQRSLAFPPPHTIRQARLIQHIRQW